MTKLQLQLAFYIGRGRAIKSHFPVSCFRQSELYSMNANSTHKRCLEGRTGIFCGRNYLLERASLLSGFFCIAELVGKDSGTVFF